MCRWRKNKEHGKKKSKRKILTLCLASDLSHLENKIEPYLGGIFKTSGITRSQKPDILPKWEVKES